MSLRLPPLNALRAFEAASRHGSFLKAARELNVSPGAVSQQVRLLEQHLGVDLFRRLTRGVALTDSGQSFGRRIGELFVAIEEATRQLRPDGTGEVLTISAMPSFEVSWLIPRLGALAAAYPDITVRVVPESVTAEVAGTDADLAIRYGGSHHPSFRTETLLPRTVFPVCSPQVMSGPHPIRELADLTLHMALHEDLYSTIVDATWAGWLAAVGAPGLKLRPGPSFTYSHMALQVVKAGQGVALATTVLAGDDLAAGRLVRPLPHKVESEFPYWLIYRPTGPKRATIKVFRDWIMDEAERFQAATVGV